MGGAKSKLTREVVTERDQLRREREREYLRADAKAAALAQDWFRIQAEAERVRGVLRDPRNRLIVETALLRHVISDDPSPLLPPTGSETPEEQLVILVGFMNCVLKENRVDPFEDLPGSWEAVRTRIEYLEAEVDCFVSDRAGRRQFLPAESGEKGPLLCAVEEDLRERGENVDSARSLKRLFAKLEAGEATKLNDAEIAALKAFLRLPYPARMELRLHRNAQRRATDAEAKAHARHARRECLEPLLRFRRMRQSAWQALRLQAEDESLGTRGESRTRPKGKKKRGRQQKYTPKLKKQVREAWSTGEHRTFDALAQSLRRRGDLAMPDDEQAQLSGPKVKQILDAERNARKNG